MKSVLGYVNSKTAESTAAVRWSARVAVIAVTAALVFAWMVAGPFSSEADAATPQTTVATGCYANSAGCGLTNDAGAPDYVWRCGGATLIGGVFGGYEGAAAGGLTCAWIEVW